MAESRATVTKKKQAEPEKVWLDSDATFEDVLEAVGAGKDVFFEDRYGLDGLCVLAEKQLADLPALVRTRYQVAKESAKRVESQNDVDPELLELELTALDGRASDKLEIFDQDKRYHYRWVRKDNIRKRQKMGYELAKGKDDKSYYGAERGFHSVKGDQQGLYLMKVPVERHKAIKKASAEKGYQKYLQHQKSVAGEINRAAGSAEIGRAVVDGTD